MRHLGRTSGSVPVGPVTGDPRAIARALGLGLLLGLLVVARPAPAVAHEVVITGSALQPARITVKLHERVTFVNRSGDPVVHVEFQGASGRHHVFQIPGWIWAEFHQPGPHPYAVHVGTARVVEHQGVVEVEPGPAGSYLPACPSFTVNAVCVEP